MSDIITPYKQCSSCASWSERGCALPVNCFRADRYRPLVQLHAGRKDDVDTSCAVPVRKLCTECARQSAAARADFCDRCLELGNGPTSFWVDRTASAYTTGRKDDAEKPRYDLLPFDALDPVVRVLTSGARRYGDENWRKVEHAPRRYLAAALRHVTAWASGRENDVDTGESHLAHAVCCLLFLLALQAKPPAASAEDP